MPTYSRNATLSLDLTLSNAVDADTNFKGESTINITTSAKFSSAKRALLRFKRPSRLRSGDVIDSAILTLNFSTAAGINTIPLTFAPILNSHLLTEDATWNDVDGSLAWDAGGGDFDPSTLATVEYDAPRNTGDESFDIAEVIASAIAHNPNSPYIDILVKQSSESATYSLIINAYADDDTEPDAEAPRLSLTFTNATVLKGGGGTYLAPGSVSADPGLRSLPFGSGGL